MISKALESLVARGRYANDFREQREIAFGLVDFSTHPELHEQLVKKGGVDTLLHFLTAIQDAEAQQFAALAVANMASSTSVCQDIVMLDGALAGLIHYVGNEGGDSIGRQYCALALGNVLVEPGTHTSVVEAGGIGALLTMLKNCCDAKEFDAARYPTVAISHIASNPQYHWQIMLGGALELLVALACCEDSDTQRHALAAVRGLCTTAENRVKFCKNGILDPLILMSRSNKIEVVREVTSALNVMSLEEENKEEISYRAMSSLISLLVSGDGDVERNSCCTIANLVEVKDIHSRFLEELGLSPLIALCSSPYGPCRAEALRAVANLSSNPELIFGLIQHNALKPLLSSIEHDGDNCHYAALALANIATQPPSLMKLVQAGAIPHIVALVSGPNNNLAGRRYGALVLTNMTSCLDLHSVVLNDKAPEALFALSTSSNDVESRRFVSTALANLCLNTATHERIVASGGLLPIIDLARDGDSTVHRMAVMALRGLSATSGANLNIVHESGLEPLCRLLHSNENNVLIEAAACICNLSLIDESKLEIVRSGAVSPLTSLIRSEDNVVSQFACDCLANLAELDNNRECIVREGAVTPCISNLRSQHLEVQQASGRLLSNLAASKHELVADAIIDGGGHKLLISFLLSHDITCQMIGASGVANLCTHNRHQRTLVDALGPLQSLACDDNIEPDKRRISMLGIANLASCFENHEDFVSQGLIPILVAFSTSTDAELRNYAAHALAEIARNSEMTELITKEGGLHAVLYLARSDDRLVQRHALPALTMLSFLDSNKPAICTNGALPPLLHFICLDGQDEDGARLACCIIANLVEIAGNMSLVVKDGYISQLVGALECASEAIQRESARALGNLAVNIDYCDLVLKHGAVKGLVTCFRSQSIECQRMAAMALSNLSSNPNSHAELLTYNILDHVKSECLVSLDPKSFSDHETERFCILIIANIIGGSQNHDLDTFFDILMGFTRHRAVRCRLNAIIALGNMCTKSSHLKRLRGIKCTDSLISYSFPPATEESVNAQFQAIVGLHSMSKQAELRGPLLREGILEPLVISTQGNNRFSCVELQQEAAATLSNLTQHRENRVLIAKSGALSALVNLLKKSDSVCHWHAGTALANLAESIGEVHTLLLNEHCLDPMCRLIHEQSVPIHVKREISRCICLLSSNAQSHTDLLHISVVNSIKILLTTNDTCCERFGALTVANLVLVNSNDKLLIDANFVELLIPLSHSEDAQTLRGTSLAIQAFSIHVEHHSKLESSRAISSLVTLARCADKDTVLQATIAIKLLCRCEMCRSMYAESLGHPPLLALASSGDLETKREVAAALRNISISDQQQISLMNEQGIVDTLAMLARDPDDIVSYQAHGVIANLSESHANQIYMVEQGMLQHLQFSLISKSIPVTRELMRAIANLSSTRKNTPCIASSGALGHIIHALDSPDLLCRRFASMAMSNLASSYKSNARIVRENGVPSLIAIIRQPHDPQSQHHAMACLANLASCHELHRELIECGTEEISKGCIKSSDLNLRTSALLCISNFASNRETHAILERMTTLVDELIENLGYNNRLIQLRAVSSLRGLSIDAYHRELVISRGGPDYLLSFVHVDDKEIKTEVLSTLCNLSLSGYMGESSNSFLQKVDMPNLLSFLCNSESTHRLFGAIAIGNIASNLDLQAPVLKSGALCPLIGVAVTNVADVESQRCIAYAICNLSVQPSNRLTIIRKGGLPSIMYLCQTDDSSDMLVALSSIRGLASSFEARRLLVDEGVLHGLSLAMKSTYLKCRREIGAILVLLSLNEENKFDLVRSDEMNAFISLADMDDVYCASYMHRALGNLSENHELHSDLMQFFNVEQLLNRCVHSDPLVAREISRLVANLAGNCSAQFTLESEIRTNLCTLCKNPDTDICRYSLLTLFNLCLSVTSRLDFEGEDWICMLSGIIDHDTTQCRDGDDTTFLKKIESKCVACLVISTLCKNASFARRLVEASIIPALLKQLELGNRDMNLAVAFVLSKISVFSFTHNDFHDPIITTFNGDGNGYTSTYLITVFRRLCCGESQWVERVAPAIVNFMSKSYDLQNIGLCREISSCVCHLALLNETRNYVIDSDMIHLILKLAQSSDEEVSRFALGTLANIANDRRYHDFVARQTGVLHSFILAAKSTSLCTVRESSRALANVLSSSLALSTFLEEDGIQLLVNLSSQDDYECKYNAAVAFRKLSANIHSHQTLISQYGVTTMIRLAIHGEQNIQLLCAAALKDISSNEQFKVALADMGVIPTAIELASHSDIRIVAIAFGIVRHLSIPMLLKKNLSDSGIVSLMVECASTTDNADVCYECSSSIANMAELAHNRPNLVQMGVVPCLVSLSKHSSSRVKIETTRAFLFLSSYPEIVGVFDEHVLTHVLALLRLHEEETGRDGASTVFNIATSPEMITLIGVLGGIVPLVLLLASPYVSCQINACRALSRLTVLMENIASFLSCGGMNALLQLCISSSDQEMSLAATMVLCNLSTCPECHGSFIEDRGLSILNGLLSSDCPLARKNAIMVLCNLTSHIPTQDHVLRQASILKLLDMANDTVSVCRTYAAMTVCNLSSNITVGSTILDSGRLIQFATNLGIEHDTALLRSTLSVVYNLSACEESHQLFVRENVVPSVVNIITGRLDISCRRLALMVLTNLACNHQTRAHAIRGGGLQAAMIALTDDDPSLQQFACICLANMSNDVSTQAQIVVHGGLMSLVNHVLKGDSDIRYYASMVLSNVAESESNHLLMIKQGVFKAFVDSISSSHQKADEILYITFGFANLTRNGDMLLKTGRCGAIIPLKQLLNSYNLHSKCLAIASFRRLAMMKENRDKLMDDGLIRELSCAVNSSPPEIQREIAYCLCNLSLNSNRRVCIARSVMRSLTILVKSDDVDTVKFSIGVIGNLTEDIAVQSCMQNKSVLDIIIASLDHDDVDVKYEAARAISNLLSSSAMHAYIIRRGLHSLILLSTLSCQECRYLTALIFRKLSVYAGSHVPLINDGLLIIMSLVENGERKTRINALTVLRNLSASHDGNGSFFTFGLPATMAKLVHETDHEIRLLAVTILRHLSASDSITVEFVRSGIMQSVLQCISEDNEDLRCQVAGLFANLSEHVNCQSTIVSNGIVYAIESILPIHENEYIWQDCSRTLANLSSNERLHFEIYRQGGLQTLAKLSKTTHEACQRYAVIAMSFLSSSIEVQRSLLNGNNDATLPFCGLSASKPIDFQRAAAAAFASMSLNQYGKTLLLAKGFVSPLLELCIHDDLYIQRDAMFCVANFAGSQEFCQFVVKEGGIATIKTSALSTKSDEVLRDAVRAMALFSVDVATKEIMISQEIPKVMWKLAKSSDSETQRFVALAVCNLCMGTREQKELLVKQDALRALLFLLRFPDLEIERCASLSVAALALGSNMNKAEIIDFGFVRPLLETITYPDTRICHCALLALNGIALGEQAETKDIVLRENGLASLFERINTNEHESIRSGIYLLGTLAESTKSRDALMAMDCMRLIVEKASLGPIEIKQAAAYFLCIVSECPEYHDEIMRVGGLESAVALASLVDKECQAFGSLALAFLAKNPTFQVSLVKMGAVRPLVTMIDANSDSKHYATLALVKLADNFENHITIAGKYQTKYRYVALFIQYFVISPPRCRSLIHSTRTFYLSEQGGIGALLSLGKSKISCANMQYKASLTVGHLAKNAYSQIDSSSPASHG